jgi:hypothetical protein
MGDFPGFILIQTVLGLIKLSGGDKIFLPGVGQVKFSLSLCNQIPVDFTVLCFPFRFALRRSHKTFGQNLQAHGNQTPESPDR